MPAKTARKPRDKKFRLVFEQNPFPMWILHLQDQRFLAINRAGAQLYGYSQDEFCGLTLSDLQNAEESRRFLAAALNGSHAEPAVWRQRAKSGNTLDIEITAQPVHFAGHQAVLAVISDTSGRRQLEDQLRQARKMEAVGMLAGGVAHDFNNLLTIITGYSQLVLNNLSPEDYNRYSVEQIMKAGERAAALTQQLLAFSRRQTVQLKVLDLNRLVTSLSTMLQRLIGEDVDLRLVLRPDVGRVQADNSQVEQVLMNLVVNARDAMPNGGMLTVETANVELDEDTADQRMEARRGPHVMLAVSDNGAGMDEVTRARLFEPFFTTKGAGKGTGLGLFTVYGIVKQCGGNLQVSSELGQGTTVKVFLPRIDQPVALAPEVQHKVVNRGRAHETILLVEDDDMVRNLVRESLQSQGYTVLDASNPGDARRTADSFQGAIDLLVTDVVMPQVNGRELAKQLVGQRPSLKVLYISGYTDNAITNIGLSAREAFLQKPFTPAGLVDKVRELLESDGVKRRMSGQ